MAGPLNTKNRKIMQLIGQTPSARVLGLLPVDSGEQKSILELVKTLSKGSIDLLERLLQNHPAATCYAMALALSENTTTANFYDALEDGLGVKFPPNRRAGLSVAFDEACRTLGLAMPMAKSGAEVGDKHLRPFIFQAGILHYWVEDLAKGVVDYLETNPCPDPEDDQQVEKFTRFLPEKLIAGSRVRRTVESEVGPMVCRAILIAFSTRDFDQLPPHLREPMKEARQKTGGESIRSPYLRYNSDDGSMEVVLPKQSSRLVDYRSCWVLGANTYSAMIERTLAVSDLTGPRCELLLQGLRNRFQDQPYSVKLSLDEADPFFIFRASDGRRKPVGLGSVIELPLGDYHVVLPVDLQTNDEDSFLKRGGHKAGKVELFPGRADFEIFLSDKKVVIRPELGSDLLLRDDAGNKMQSLEGAVIHYGDSIEMDAYTPKGAPGDSEEMEFRIESVENPGVQAKTLSRKMASSRGAYDFYDVTGDLLRPFLKDLTAGIHEVQVTAEGPARKFSRKFFYWKGYRRTTKNFGFNCDEPPRNFDQDLSSGVLKTAKGLQICADHAAPEVVIGIKNPKKTFTLAKPGIWLRLRDPQLQDSRPIPLGKSIEVNGNEQLILESGDTLPWQIYCESDQRAELKPGQAKQVLNLGALLSQFGDSLTLQARHASDQKVTLLSFSKANLARQLVVRGPGGGNSSEKLNSGAAQTGSGEAAPAVRSPYQASFLLGRAQIHQLEVITSNFAEVKGEDTTQHIEVAEGEFPIKVGGSELGKIVLKIEGSDWLVSVEADPSVLDPGVYLIDFRSRKEGQRFWQNLKVADKHGLSESRLVICTMPECAEDDSLWGRTLQAAFANPAQQFVMGTATVSCSPKEIERVLKRLQEALLFKYASPVWRSVQWLEAALVRTCQQFYAAADGPTARVFAGVAVAGLAQKARDSLSIYTTLVFGGQPLVIASTGANYSLGDSDSQAGRTLGEIGKLGSEKSLKDYAFNNFGKGCAYAELLGCFNNFNLVSRGKDPEFRDFKWQDYFKKLATESQEIDMRQAEVTVDLLLTPEHFWAAVTVLNRRFRPLESARNSNETGEALAHLNREIQACCNQLDVVSPTVKESAGIPNFLSLTIPINIAESELVQGVSDILLTVTGLARLNANGLIEREVYLNSLGKLISEDGNLAHRTSRLCLLLSLAPELFAFYMLLWEVTLKPRAKN